MNKLLEKVKDLVGKHPEKADEALDKAGKQADERTGHKYTGQIDKGVDTAKEQIRKDHPGEGDTQP